MSNPHKTTVRLLALATVVSLSATGCVGAKDSSNKPSHNASAKHVSLTITANDVAGGKNAAEANWIKKQVIPGFKKNEKAKGVDAKVKFQGSGVDDEKYKTKLELNLKSGEGPDVMAIDGSWLGELASARYLKPLDQVAGDDFTSWSGWHHIPKTVQNNLTYKNHRYGIPNGTDGRVIYYNKKLFKRADISTSWQPTSWHDVIQAGRKLKKLKDVTPIQLNAGVPMGEATTTQGFLPLLAGTGTDLFDETSKKWQGANAGVTDVLKMYHKVYHHSKLGDAKMQQDKSGRDESFAQFSQGKIGMLLESDYLWRSVICPDKKTCGKTSMPHRNRDIGWARIPAKSPGQGVKDQKFVSVSGGTGWVLNPSTKYPKQTWDLLKYMQSKKEQLALSNKQTRIAARNDVNKKTIANDPLLKYISTKVLPITVYRPSNSHYDDVSQDIQQATEDIVSGKTADQAANRYESNLVKSVGKKHVAR